MRETIYAMYSVTAYKCMEFAFLAICHQTIPKARTADIRLFYYNYKHN